MPQARKALLIIIDAARRDDTHAAFAVSRMPALSEAATATLIAPSCWTLPSVTSTLTGLFPVEHGMTWPFPDESRCVAPTIADILTNAGRTFGLLSGNQIYAPPVIDFPPQTAQFERLRYGRLRAFLGRTTGLLDYGSRWILSRVQQMAAENALPDLLMLHLQEAHHPYLAPPRGAQPIRRLRYGLGHLAYYFTTPAQVWEFAARADDAAWEHRRARYRECLDYTVGIVEEVLRVYDRAGLLEDALVIITADHGEHLGEHGLADHQASLHDQLVKCPCALLAPEVAPGTVIPGQLQHTDLLLTICRYLRAPCDRYAPGWPPIDMLSIEGAQGHEHAFMQWRAWGEENLAELARRNPSYDFAPLNRDLMGVRTERWKYISGGDGSERLFDLRRDPSESRNCLAEQPDAAAELKRALARWLKAMRSSDSGAGRSTHGGTGVTEHRLRDLGYI